MRKLPFILALMLALASCASLRKETTSTTTTATDTIHVTVTDTTHVTVIHQTDSADNAQSHRRDSIIIKEIITTHYDPTTGLMIEQIVDKLTSQVSDIDEFRQTILHQQHIIDSLLTANITLHNTHQSDSTNTESISEKGDAARTGWQSLLRTGKGIFIFGMLLLFLIVGIQLYRKSKQ